MAWNKFSEVCYESLPSKTFRNSEAAAQEVFWVKVFWKYAANLQENTHVEVCFQ